MAPTVDSTVGEGFQSEDLPEDATLYMRIHKNMRSAKKQRFGVDAFRDSGEGAQAGMSTNWSKYASAEDTRNQATSRSDENYVIQMKVRDVLTIPGLAVKHTPLPGNRAHVDVIGDKTLEVKDALRRICEVVLRPSDS